MQVIDRALELLDDGRAWGQGFYAHTPEGKAVASTDEAAERFCCVGAIYRAATDLGVDYKQALLAIQKQIDYPNVALWNDDPQRTFGQVREVFARASFEGAEPPRREWVS